MFSAVEIKAGNVAKSWLVASDDSTTKCHGYSSALSSSEIRVESLIGSSVLPVPAFGLFATELPGTIKVGMLGGIVAVDGKTVFGDGVTSGEGVFGLGADGVGEVFEAVLITELMIRYVCDGT